MMTFILTIIQDKFFLVLLIAMITTLVSHIGYTVLAERIVSVLQMIFFRVAHREHLSKWNELRKAKHDLSQIAAQDEFAKWAKLQRKIDQLQLEFDTAKGSMKRVEMFMIFVIGILM